jgi:hypothetical protein
MIEMDETVQRDIILSRLASFISRYFYETNWTQIAISCGVIKLLEQPKHERVRRAQSWNDDDYPEAITIFLIDVFDLDERIGKILIHEIISQRKLDEVPKTQLDKLLKFFGSSDFDILDVFPTLQVNATSKYIDVIKYPDDFYKKLIDEINFQFVNNQPISLSILIRKLFESLICDIFRKKYGTNGLDLYYDVRKGRLNDFSVLLKNLESKLADFQHLSKSLDKKFIKELNEHRERGNYGAHSIDFYMDLEYFTEHRDDINHKVQLLMRILDYV